MKYLGNGAARIAFLQDDGTVLKIPLNESGQKQNDEEFKTYNESKDKDCLCKILNKTDKGWLVCEYLENATDLIMYYREDGIFCQKYDISVEQTLHIDCDLNCANCKFNKLKDVSYDLSKFDNYKTEYLLQVGFDQGGNLKLFDYGTPNGKVTRYFHEGYLPLFYEWLESGSELFFEDWINAKKPNEIIEKNESYLNRLLQHCNRVKRKKAVKRHMELKEGKNDN